MNLPTPEQRLARIEANAQKIFHALQRLLHIPELDEIECDESTETGKAIREAEAAIESATGHWERIRASEAREAEQPSQFVAGLAHLAQRTAINRAAGRMPFDDGERFDSDFGF